MLNVGLVQINNRFSGQCYLPLSVGMIQAYIEKNAPGKYNFLLPIYAREKVDIAVGKLLTADVVFFSIYVWNERISIEIAKRLKAKRPHTLIAFGGPQVPDKQVASFVAANPFIDAIVHGEGEFAAHAVLRYGAHFGKSPWLKPLIIHGDRSKSPSDLPSPYLSGTFDALMAANPQEKWIGLWETNRGCPFSCTFCDWGSATASKVFPFDIDRLYAEVNWFADHRIEFVFCCDANFGILARDSDLASYVAEVKNKTGYPKALSVQATKNATERAYNTQKILADAGLNKGVDIALQSGDPATLQAIKRDNISTKTYHDLQQRFIKDGIETYTDLILGLPGETYDSFVKTVNQLISNGQHNRIQFNNLSILPNAEMGDPVYQAKYGLIMVEGPAVNIHGAKDEEEIQERQVLVVGTATMPPDAWREARVFAWMAALLHFDKLLQLPFRELHKQGVSYLELVEHFLSATSPIISEIVGFFRTHARYIQAGGPEYVLSEDWLPIYWPADEYILIELHHSHGLRLFYSEAIDILAAYDPQIARLALRNYRAMRRPDEYPTFDDWCREVIWYGNKRGAYWDVGRLDGHF